MGDGPELFQDERRYDENKNDQVALILSSQSFEHRKATRTQAPGLDDRKETDHKHGEIDLLGFVKLAANDSKKSEFHTTEEKLLVEYQRPQRVRIVMPGDEDRQQDAPKNLPAPSEKQTDSIMQQRQQQLPAEQAQQLPSERAQQLPAERAQQLPAEQAQQEANGEVTAVVVGYKKHTVDHVARHKHPEVLGGIFNIDTDSFNERESALVKRGNEERYAEKTTKREGGSVNVGPIPLVYIGDRGSTNYYEYKRTKLDPDQYVKTNLGFLPIEE